MTPKQLLALLDKTRKTQRGMAQELGISERNMRRYCAGDLPIPRVVELAVNALVDTELKRGTKMNRDAQIRMQSEYETMVMMGHPVELTLDRVSSRWGLAIDDLREIVSQYSADATHKAAQDIRDAQAYAKKQADIERRREAGQHKPDPRLSKLRR